MCEIEGEGRAPNVYPALRIARTLLTELADGVDPLTGECLPSDSVCNRPEIIRALHCVLRYVSDRPKRSAPLPNAGKPWTEADEAALMQMFDAGCSMEEMQARFQPQMAQSFGVWSASADFAPVKQ